MVIKFYYRGMLLIVFIMIANLHIFAQQVFDKAHSKFIYNHVWHFDTIKLHDVRKDLIILQVGRNISKSYSFYTFQSDSLRSTSDGSVVFRQSLRKAIDDASARGEIFRNPPYRRRMSTMIYKNYPQGKVTITDNINTNYYIYTEDFHSQTWQIIDSTKTMMEYTCQMAISDFRGRRWIAWFAPDIPISDGPWKFSGLPGLIMEVYDTKDHYRFTIVGMEQVQDEPIVFSPVVLGHKSYGKYEETSRLEFLRALARYRGMSSAIMNAELGVQTFDETTQSSIPHDFMERDYKNK
jgi:GLPGLI family protein